MLNILNRFECQVNAFAIVSSEDGVITVSNDRTLKVWLRRDNGQYWPSVCYTLPDFGTAISFDERQLKMFVGINMGIIQEFKLAEDFNSVALNRDFHAHSGAVTDVVYSPAQEYLLSTSRDKTFQYFHAHNGALIGRILLESQVLCLAFDALSNHVFVGEYNGKIQMYQISDTEYKFVNTFIGHEGTGSGLFFTGSIRQLAWEPEKKWLVSCSFDQAVIVWDIGGMKGDSYELRFHKSKVNSIVVLGKYLKLLSSSEDSHLVFWRLDVQRETVKPWEESDACQICQGPFLWSFKQMYQDKVMGRRQHHCRKCGKALCANCCSQTSVMPKAGFEFPQRLCSACFDTLTADDKKSMATKHNVKSPVHLMKYDDSRKLLVVAGRDNLIKFIDISQNLAN